MNTSRVALTVGALAALAGGGWYLWSRPATHPGPAQEVRAVPVVTARVQERPMPVRVEAVGTVQALAVVAVRPRVEGEVTGVHFREGDEVAEGARLFTLDSRQAEVTRRQAEANLARDRAQLDRARADLARYQELLKAGTATRQKLEQAAAESAQAEAAVKADQAAIDTARLSIEYASIRAPVAGRTGTINAKLGSLATPGDGQPRVPLTQMRPVNAAFSVAEPLLPAVRAAMGAGPLEARVKSAADPGLDAIGQLSFLDSAIDTTTGTIALKAIFANHDTRLWPGQFVNLTLLLGTEAKALAIPAEAVQNGQDGTFVFVIDDQSKADVRPVRVNRVVDGAAVIAQGLEAGMRVVTQGQMRLAPGRAVSERGQQAAAP